VVQQLKAQFWNLVTAKEAAKRKDQLGLGVQKRRGFGFEPLSESANPEYFDNERTDDATKIFIWRCVRAYREGTLTPTHPIPHNNIHATIRQTGGNIKWLSIDRRRRLMFHEEYCQLVKQRVPYEQVWQEHPQPKSKAKRPEQVETKRTKLKKD